ncbi:GAF domain-containing protein [Candidatus Obscuribacterales bacterium]|nr:GAF domain-containing protein [Candidatus Obscuribacterales bacterium]
MSFTKAVLEKSTGEMRDLILQKDWSKTELGPIDSWPSVFQTALGIALNSKFPMVLWFGENLLMLYNDAWRPIAGQTKHPHFLGEPCETAWAEIWDVVGPMLKGVMESGTATWVHDQLLVLNRNNYIEEAYFTYSYSPIYDEAGVVKGVFTAVTETTHQVITNRRIAFLRELAEKVFETDSVDETVQSILKVLNDNRKDVPFAAIYLRDNDRMVLRGSTEPLPEALAPHTLPFDDTKVASTFANAQPFEITEHGMLSSVWDQAVEHALLLPLSAVGQSEEVGYLLVGLNPRRSFGDPYQSFLEILTGQIASAINSALDASRLRFLVEKRTEELQDIGNILNSFVDTGSFREASTKILRRALDETQSEYGFCGATVPGGPQGTTLRVFADLGFTWSETTNRELYEKIIADYDTRGYVEFPQLDNLFGWAITNGKPMIANSPSSDSRRSGRQPAGHPPTHSFMALPVFKGEQVVGVMGLANKQGGYSEADVKALESLLKTTSVIFDSYRRLQNENKIIQERIVAEDNLRRANQALIDLAYSVSHELQEPLTSMRGDLSLLAARYRDRLGADADQFIQDAVKANVKINWMIDDLWTYARIDRPHLVFSEVAMNKLFDDEVKSMQNFIEEKKATVLRTDLPTVMAEPKELVILLQKLLDNALKFSGAEPEIDFTATQLVDEWLFCMTDNGIGFMQTEAREIFKMFRKLDRNSEGTGMGLAIAKRIVEFHGGRIWAESEPGHGTKFYFTLPLVPIR